MKFAEVHVTRALVDASGDSMIWGIIESLGNGYNFVKPEPNAVSTRYMEIEGEMVERLRKETNNEDDDLNFTASNYRELLRTMIARHGTFKVFEVDTAPTPHGHSLPDGSHRGRRKK